MQSAWTNQKGSTSRSRRLVAQLVSSEVASSAPFAWVPQEGTIEGQYNWYIYIYIYIYGPVQYICINIIKYWILYNISIKQNPIQGITLPWLLSLLGWIAIDPVGLHARVGPWTHGAHAHGLRPKVTDPRHPAGLTASGAMPKVTFGAWDTAGLNRLEYQYRQ